MEGLEELFDDKLPEQLKDLTGLIIEATFASFKQYMTELDKEKGTINIDSIVKIMLAGIFAAFVKYAIGKISQRWAGNLKKNGAGVKDELKKISEKLQKFLPVKGIGADPFGLHKILEEGLDEAGEELTDKGLEIICAHIAKVINKMGPEQLSKISIEELGKSFADGN